MEIETTRFGRLSVDDERIITFPKGLLGFPNHTRFALIQTGEENYFFWLQSVDEPNLAFVVTDPSIFFKDYEVPIREETQAELELDRHRPRAGVRHLQQGGRMADRQPARPDRGQRAEPAGVSRSC